MGLVTASINVLYTNGAMNAEERLSKGVMYRLSHLCCVTSPLIPTALDLELRIETIQFKIFLIINILKAGFGF